MRRSAILFAALPLATLTLLAAPRAEANPTVIDLVPGGSADRFGAIVGGPVAYVYTNDSAGNAKLYRSDGTGAGTARVETFPVVGQFSRDLGLHASTSKGLFFQPGKLALHDGTLNGTTLLGDPPTTGGFYVGALSNGIHLFHYTKSAGLESLPLFKSDGTAAKTGSIAGAVPAFGSNVAILGASAFFVRGDGSIGKTDGASVTTLYTPSSSRYAKDVMACGAKLYVVMQKSGAGSGLFVTDGASAPSVLNEAATFYASSMLCAGARLFFVGSTSAAGDELWTSDGTVPGTRITKDIAPAAADGVADKLNNSTLGDGRIYFVANDGTNGLEPWTSDGTEAGTKMLADVTPGAGGAGCLWVTAETVNGKAYCTRGVALHEASATDFVDRSAAFSMTSRPDRLTSAVVGTKILYKGQSYAPATGTELVVLDTAQPFDVPPGGGVVPPTGDAGAPSDGGAADGAAADGGVSADGGGPTDDGDGDGEGTDDDGAGAPGPADSAGEEGCSSSPVRGTHGGAPLGAIALGLALLARSRGRLKSTDRRSCARGGS